MFNASARRRKTDSVETLRGRDYLKRLDLDVYLADALEQLIEYRYENPLEYLDSYFTGILQGSHVVGREFEYIQATAQNRLSFITNFDTAYENLDDDTMILKMDFYQLVTMLCQDFPMSLVDDVSSLIGVGDDAADKLSSWRRAFEMIFYLKEFLYNCRVLFAGLTTENSDEVDVRDIQREIRAFIHAEGSNMSVPRIADMSLIWREYNTAGKVSFHSFRLSMLRSNIYSRVVEYDRANLATFLIPPNKTNTFRSALPDSENRQPHHTSDALANLSAVTKTDVTGKTPSTNAPSGKARRTSKSSKAP
eukprot:GFYU01019494.1.p1 GENE.GFYU01019494.1~~GFYU01019494.1.p1  ORF type:complete len:307 (-),score=49.06 GFYU01019494.1:176-1096(-)